MTWPVSRLTRWCGELDKLNFIMILSLVQLLLFLL